MAVECLVVFMLHLKGPKAEFRRLIEGSGFGFEHYFSGPTLGLQVVLWTVFLLPGLFLALVAGDVVSKEVEEGTMRMMLCRPVSRWRLGMLKFVACVIYTAALTAFYGLTALAAGLLSQGTGGLFAFAPAPFKVREYTILGMSRQICANSTTGDSPAGSWSAVGQNPSISS